MSDKIYDLASRERPTVHKAVADSFAQIKDKPCWNAKQGHGSFLTFEFGEPSLVVNEYQRTSGKPGPDENPKVSRRTATVRGQWHLYIFCCHWKITFNDGTEAASDSSREEIEKALAKLSGQILSKATVAPRNGSSQFVFDLGGKLQTMPYEENTRSGEPHENWMFFEAENVLTYRADGKYAFHPPDKTSKEWFT
ncbi:MAG TPA: hypothetical protein V6D22_02590 [Candidatus Obscuribacterales bacterium]